MTDLPDESAILRAERDAAVAQAEAIAEELADARAQLGLANDRLQATNAALKEKVRALDEANADLRSLLAAEKTPKIFLDRELNVKRITSQAAEIFPSGLDDAVLEPETPEEANDPDSFLDVTARVLDTAIEEEFEWSHAATERSYLVRAVPFGDEEKSTEGVALTLADITELRESARMLETEQARTEHALVEIEELYRTLPTALALFDTRKRYVRVNQKLADLDGVPVEDHIGRTVSEVSPVLALPVSQYLDEVIANGEPVLGIEIIGSRRCESDIRRIFEVDFYPVKIRGKLIGVGVVAHDRTADRAAQIEMKRVMRELQHRVKNILANVIAVINQSRRSTEDPETAIETLSDRVHALAATHNLLSVQDWRSTSLKAIAEQELVEVYGERNAVLEGPPVELSAKSALAIAMSLHEMATNAAKYGALSAADGKVHLTWGFKDENLELCWREEGGPPATEPERLGFGTMLVISTIEKSLGGSVQRYYEPSGFRSVLSLPGSILHADDDQGDEPNADGAGRSADPLS